MGAGKTTFIKELISKVYKESKIVLIENEFGEIGIDGKFMQDSGIEVTEMNSGCMLHPGRRFCQSAGNR